MEQIVELAKMLSQGDRAPWVIAAIGYGLWFFERKEVSRLQKDLFALAQAVTASSAKNEEAIHGLRELLLHYLK